MTPDWTPLEAEFAEWDAAGLTLDLWWRDDDAVADTAALERLTALSGALDMPVHLAVIPRLAQPSLARAVAAAPHLRPVVHGWAHVNHAPASEKKSEFGTSRPLTDRIADARAGLRRLGDLFGDRLRPVFVPPWNRIGADLPPELPALGFTALSIHTPRHSALAAPGLAQINTHLDPVDWRGTRGLVAPDTLIAQIAAQLADRRLGRADTGEPYGLLTHHLVHDADVWAFVEALLRSLLDGPVRPWTVDTLPDTTTKEPMP